MKFEAKRELMCIHKEGYPENHPCKTRVLIRGQNGWVRCFGGEGHKTKVDCSYADSLNIANETRRLTHNCWCRLGGIINLLEDLEAPDSEPVVKAIRDLEETYVEFNRLD